MDYFSKLVNENLLYVFKTNQRKVDFYCKLVNKKITFFETSR